MLDETAHVQIYKNTKSPGKAEQGMSALYTKLLAEQNYTQMMQNTFC